MSVHLNGIPFHARHWPRASSIQSSPLLPLDWSKCRSAFEPCVVCVLSRNAIHFATKAFTQRFSEADGGVAQQAANHI